MSEETGVRIPCLMCGRETPAPASVPDQPDLLGWSVLCDRCGPQVASSPKLQRWLGQQAKARGPQVAIRRIPLPREDETPPSRRQRMDKTDG